MAAVGRRKSSESVLCRVTIVRISAGEPCPLPEDPTLVAVATALDETGAWGWVVDASWRFVYLSYEHRLGLAGGRLSTRRSASAVAGELIDEIGEQAECLVGIGGARALDRCPGHDDGGAETVEEFGPVPLDLWSNALPDLLDSSKCRIVVAALGHL